MKLLPRFGKNKKPVRNPFNVRHRIDNIREDYIKRLDKLITSPTYNTRTRNKYNRVIRQCDKALANNCKVTKSSLLFDILTGTKPQEIAKGNKRKNKALNRDGCGKYHRFGKLHFNKGKSHFAVPIKKSAHKEIIDMGGGNAKVGLKMLSALHKNKPIEELEEFFFP